MCLSAQSHKPQGWIRSSRRNALTLVSLALFAGATVTPSAQAAPPVNAIKPGIFGGTGDTAILGYDTVAYFTDGKPAKGQDKLAAEYMGAKWLFASQAHLDAFKAEPAKYAPQYGGYCAYGVSQDNLVSIEPDKFKVLDGKLYLNYNAEVQAKWLQDPQGFIRTADTKFQALLRK